MTPRRARWTIINSQSDATISPRPRLRTAQPVRGLACQERALRLHCDASPRRQDGGLHSRLAARGRLESESSLALRLSLALPQTIEDGGVGLSARCDGAAAAARCHRARERAARRLSEGRAGAPLRRRQPGCAARHLSRRHRARRIRGYGPEGVVGDHPAGVSGPARLGGVHRHAQGPQRLLRAVAARAIASRLVHPDAQGKRHRPHSRKRACARQARSQRRAIRAGIRVLVRRRGGRRLLREADGARRGGAAHHGRAVRSGGGGVDELGSRHPRRDRDLVRAGDRPRDQDHRLLRGLRRRSRPLRARACGAPLRLCRAHRAA
jgi:hypothetical protein